MNPFGKVNFRCRALKMNPLKPVLQAQNAECGLACLAMICGAHESHWDLVSIRRRFGVSLKGATLKDLVSHAAALNFSTRPLRLEIEELANLAVPCILHWDLNHFVVLKKVTRSGAILLLTINVPQQTP